MTAHFCVTLNLADNKHVTMYMYRSTLKFNVVVCKFILFRSQYCFLLHDDDGVSARARARIIVLILTAR